MSERLPEHVDLFRFADSRRMLRGRLPLARLSRLAPLLASTEGEASVVLDFGVDDMGVRFMRGSIAADLTLVCQRCLEPMPFPVAIEIGFGLVHSEREAEQTPMAWEPLVIDTVPAVLADIIEDELILALPLVSTHPQESCPAGDFLKRQAEDQQADEGEGANPFAVLSNLKRKRD